MKALKKYRWPLTGALLGVLVFLAVYGVRVLDPTSVDWILNSLSPDPIQHYLGWELFRRSPVHLPYIGANYNAVYPFRTSVLFTDSLPLAALFFKLLGGILPTRFQYFGWWGLLCYALQGGLAQAVIARIAGVQPTFGRDDKSKAAIAIIMSPGQTAKLWGGVQFADATAAADYAALLDTLAARLGDDRAVHFHAHFSRIAYTKGGEKCHLTFADTAFGPPYAPLLALLKERHLAPTIICESAGTQAEDAAALAQGYAAL